ncbi:hypothetical protein [Acidocella sp.]|uniref:hypothetical protein n=1 Tax=Acidocella sp. TaxID=50710 RepID=UPI002614984F|nr:hypothetical protein [Acidocella sp.]
MRRLATALAATLLAMPALADPLPSLVPSHDVSGIYLFTNARGPQTIAVEYSKSANVLRLTPQSGATAALYAGDAYILYDFNADDAKIILPQLQHYLEQPALVTEMQAVEGDISNGNGEVTAGATETIAGQDCTDYISTSAASQGAMLCVTPDGLLLKFTAANGDSAVAQSLSYDEVPLDDVELPPGDTLLPTPQSSGAAPP